MPGRRGDRATAQSGRSRDPASLLLGIDIHPDRSQRTGLHRGGPDADRPAAEAQEFTLQPISVAAAGEQSAEEHVASRAAGRIDKQGSHAGMVAWGGRLPRGLSASCDAYRRKTKRAPSSGCGRSSGTSATMLEVAQPAAGVAHEPPQMIGWS